MIQEFDEVCAPFFFSNYFSHMPWDYTIASLAANIATMPYNQNQCGY